MDGRTDGRSGPITRPAFAKATQVKSSGPDELVPGLTPAVLRAAPYPVDIPQPSRHTFSKGAVGFICKRTKFYSTWVIKVLKIKRVRP